jgi:hypothetical protein
VIDPGTRRGEAPWATAGLSVGSDIGTHLKSALGAIVSISALENEVGDTSREEAQEQQNSDEHATARNAPRFTPVAAVSVRTDDITYARHALCSLPNLNLL